MKISLFGELNDPFELLPHVLPTKNHRRVANILRDHLAGQRGVICFSTNWENPVMWAHYGHKHYGMCLGFDIPNELAMQISYEPKRLTFDVDLSKFNAGLTPEIVKAMLLTKFEAWRYEGEYRVMADLKDKETDGHYYASFGKTLMLREVIIGVRCETSQQEVVSWIGKIGHDIQIRKARLAFNDFKVITQKMQPVVLTGKSGHDV
ncbi:DUF2971 domain-containing protein [Burkholderia sp. S171]|uniref:DUF2971 domain-containing protein n=1 Tax=Burkholderia sp. S171 TaxID=1641860 RepID=UPI00131D6680|nr:DUF2971 domain-containing protein [Burkholderia sp. S171]